MTTARRRVVERLSRHDIARYGAALMVVVESDLLPPDPSVVVIPLIADYPAVTRLNPVIEVEGQRLVLATRLIGAVRRSAVTRVGSARAQAEEITRAIDVLMRGV